MADLTPDHDVSDGAFDGLDLGTLTDGVHASSAQWGAIATAAARRRQRRTWVVAAAALVVLLLGTSVVVLSRHGSDDGVQIAAGGTASFAYVLPPQGATVVQAEERSLYYTYAFTVEGQSFYFGGGKPPTPVSTTTVEGVTGVEGYISSGIPPGLAQVEVPALGTVSIACPSDLLPPGYQPSDTVLDGSGTVPTDADGVEWWRQGPPQALWSMGEYQATLSPSTFDGLCDPDAQPDPALVAVVERLRLGTRAEWEAILADRPPTTPYEDPTTSTTVQEDLPADRAAAEDQIRAAVESLTTTAHDQESFPYLEDGTTRAAEYREMLDTAGRQAGAQAIEGQPTTVFSLASLRFVTPERAQFSMDMQTRFASGTYEFSQDGEVLVQDGRWVISYDTIDRMLSRACLPPGGVSSECSGNGSAPG